MDALLVRKYFFSALLTVSIGLVLILFWPFLKLIVLAIVFSVLMYPVYRRLERLVKIKPLASFLTLICFIVIIGVPIYLISSTVIVQLHSIYLWVVSNGSFDTLAQYTSLWFQHIFPSVSFNLQARASTLVSELPTTAKTILSVTVTAVLSTVFMLIAMFYFLKDGSAWKEALIELIPLSNDSNRQIVETMKRAINGIVKGYLVVALAQGLITGIGLYLFHVPHAVLWATVAMVFSIIPPLGSSLVSLVLILALFIIGRSGAAIGYFFWATFFTINIDNVLRPYIVGRQIAIHPLLVVFSILGGVLLMGGAGILIGPLIVSLVYALISVYKTEMAMHPLEANSE